MYFNCRIVGRSVLWLGLAFGLSSGGNHGRAAETVIYETGFEATEGFNLLFDLEGQGGWSGTVTNDDGNSGLLEGVIPGFGQQAYLGFYAPLEGETTHSVWRPMIPPPDVTATPLLKFSVLMSIFDSDNPAARDCFDWAIYNTDGKRLFGMSFNNLDLGIFHVLENGTNFVWTGYTFERGALYELEMLMDFSANQWSAALGGVTVVTNEVITEVGSRQDLNDIAVEWYYGQLENPGNNYIVFDDFRLTSVSLSDPASPPLLSFPMNTEDERRVLNLNGEVGRRYALEISTNLVVWTPISTNTAIRATLELEDPDPNEFGTRFYRARVVP